MGSGTRAQIEADALLLGIPPNRYASTVCKRIFEGIVSGRLPLKAINDFMAGRDYKSVILIAMGK